MYKRLIAAVVTTILFVQGIADSSANSLNKTGLDYFFCLQPCERSFSDSTIEGDFEDNSIVVVLTRQKTREISRSGRVFTARDFRDVGAVYVRNSMYLNETMNYYAVFSSRCKPRWQGRCDGRKSNS